MISIVDFKFTLTPVGLVISPTFLPIRMSKFSWLKTSKPVCTCAVPSIVTRLKKTAKTIFCMFII